MSLGPGSQRRPNPSNLPAARKPSGRCEWVGGFGRWRARSASYGVLLRISLPPGGQSARAELYHSSGLAAVYRSRALVGSCVLLHSGNLSTRKTSPYYLLTRFVDELYTFCLRGWSHHHFLSKSSQYTCDFSLTAVTCSETSKNPLDRTFGGVLERIRSLYGHLRGVWKSSGAGDKRTPGE
jgi:hypothetical protein